MKDKKGTPTEDEDDLRYDRPYGWVVAIASFYCNLVVEGTAFSFGLFLESFNREFGLTKSTTSWVGSSLAGTYLLMGPLVGSLIYKFGARNVSIFGSVLSASMFLVSSTVQNFYLLILLTSVLGGIGYGMMYLPAVVTVGLFFKKRLALATGIAVCGTGAGTFIIPIIINYFLVPYGWRFTFLVLGILNFSCVLPGLAFIKNKPPRVPPIALVPPDVVWTDTKNFEEVDLESENEEDSPEIDEKALHSNLALTTSQMNMFGGSELSLSVTGSSSLFDLSLLKDLRLLFLASSGLFTVAASMTVYTYIAMFAKDVGMPEGQSSMFLSVVGLSNTLGRILLGAFTDSPHVSALVLNHIGLLGGGLVVALWPFFPFLEAFYINSILFGLSIATFGSLRSVITVEYLGRDKLSRAFGLQVVVQGISGLAAPPLGAFLYSINKDYALPFHAAGGFLTASCFLCLPLAFMSKHGQEKDEDKKVPPKIADNA